MNICQQCGLCFVAFVMILCTAVAADESHKIHWRGSSQVGQQRRLTSTLTEQSRTKVTRGEKVIQDHSVRNRLELDCVVSVLKVDAVGRPTKVRAVMTKCMFRVGDEAPQPMLTKGTIVVGEMKDGQTQFHAEDEKKPLPGLAKTSLAKMIALGSSGPDENAVFGGGRVAKPGDTWQGDKKNLVEKFRSLDANIAQGDVVGVAKFDSAVEVNGRAFVDLQFEMTAKTDKPGNPPTGMQPVEARIAVAGKLRLPANYATDWVSQTLELRLSASYIGKPRSRTAGQKMQYESTTTINAKAEYLDE